MDSKKLGWGDKIKNNDGSQWTVISLEHILKMRLVTAVENSVTMSTSMALTHSQRIYCSSTDSKVELPVCFCIIFYIKMIESMNAHTFREY